MLTQLAILALSALPGAVAWGSVGTKAAALVAQHYLAPTTVKQIQKMLGDSSAAYMQNAATSAQTYSSSAAGAWSYNGNYIWPVDDPASGYCNVSWTDCKPGGCSPNSFGNFSDILTNNPTPSTPAQKQQALQLLIALLPSISTPLNNDALNGTSTAVKFNGAATNLYAAWSDSIPASLSGNNATTLASYILGNMTKSAKGTFALPVANQTTWLKDLSTCYTTFLSNTWIKDANSLVCSSVYANGYSPSQIVNKDLAKGAYYKQATPVVQEQIAKAGYILAAFLNLVFKGEPALAVPVTADVPMCNTTALTQSGTAFKTS